MASSLSTCALPALTTSVRASELWWRRYRSVNPGVVTRSDCAAPTVRSAPLRHQGVAGSQVTSAANDAGLSHAFGPPLRAT